MSEQAAFLAPQAVAKELDISPATLRRWADEFSDHLSQRTDSGQGRSHRRYTDKDLETLQVIKELMNQGVTYEQARQQLDNQVAVAPEQATPISVEYVDNPAVDDFEQTLDQIEDEEMASDERKALVASNGNEPPAITFLTNTLTSLSDTQKSILNSQAANRELLGVLIQDNFNLKEENSRLRERILEIERTVAQSRQEEEWRREALRQEMEAKIASAQQQATEAMNVARSVEAPEIKTIKSKPGCLGALLGIGGDTQVVSVPRRRSPDSRETRQTGTPPPPPSPGQQPPPTHPKPTTLPE